jgi:small subunit ribosomal protein S10
MNPTKKPSPKKSSAPKKETRVAKKAEPKKKAETPKKEPIPTVKTEKSTPVHHAAPSPKKVQEPKAAPSIRIRLSAFDHTVLDEAAAKILDTAERSGAIVHGPIPLPTRIRKFTVNRSTFVHKDARDQFEMRTHRRLIDLKETTFKTMESLQSLSLPSGVDIEIKMG